MLLERKESKMSETIKETFTARFCGTPEEYALSALEFVCSEADRLEAENAELKTRVKQFERKEICVKENAEKLDAKESEVQNDE